MAPKKKAPKKKNRPGKSGWKFFNEARSAQRKASREAAWHHHQYMTRRSLKLKPIFRINGKSPPSAALRRFNASDFRCFADMGTQTDVIEICGAAHCSTQTDMAEIAPVGPSLPDFASLRAVPGAQHCIDARKA